MEECSLSEGPTQQQVTVAWHLRSRKDGLPVALLIPLLQRLQARKLTSAAQV